MKLFFTIMSANQFSKFWFRISFLATIVVLVFANIGLSQTIFTEDWESGIGSWYADNGVWEVGEPTVGPDSTHSGQNCSATVLNGNYPNYANTRLISPAIVLPNISNEESIQFKFWQWFNIEDVADQGVIQISVNSGQWETISDVEIDGNNPVWTQYVADLTSYAGSSVRIAFYFTSNGGGVYEGWYIDDISIEVGIVNFPNPEDFESGIGDWSADNGLWEVGEPTVGPMGAHSGQNCVGTVLDGNYSNYANTRLISPAIVLPNISNEESIQFKFWQWFNIEDVADQGVIQISVNSGQWETISDVEIDGNNPVWTQYVADLTSYAGSSVRIAFYFTSNGGGVYEGWYIDDISIEVGIVNFPNPEDFESGIGDWSADNGLWEVGEPTVGPMGAHSGQNCVGTVLDGNYSNYANTRLISPEITLTPLPGQTPMLFFYHWFKIENVADKGRIQISVSGNDWQTISNDITGNNETWSQFGLDLSNYADSTIRLGFYFTSNGGGNYEGWYIDDIRIDGIVTGIGNIQNEIPNNFNLFQNYPNPFNPTTKINYEIPKRSFVTLKVYDVLGKEVATLVNQDMSAGSYEINFDASELTSGIYFYRISAGSFTETKKMILLR